MSRHRFYAPPTEITSALIALPPDESHHLSRVLRLRPGDQACVFDGAGSEYLCRVSQASSKQAILEIIEQLTDVVESPLNLTLAQALAKGEKFDFIVQKATELGVSRIVPVVTEHSDVKISDEKAERRLGRWRRVALEALKQCGRRRLVQIEPPISFTEFLHCENPRSTGGAGDELPLVLAFTEKGGVPIDDALANWPGAAQATAVIGPEGGWSVAEFGTMAEFGFITVTLGRRVLRTETAAITAVALIQHALGDLSR